MKRRTMGRVLWHASAFGALGGLALASFGRGGARRSRKLPNDRDGENSGVSADERFMEPLGHDIAWGTLEQLDGKYAGVSVPLTRQYILIGRQSDCDVIVDEDRASRYHVILQWDHGHAYLRDNHSTNGTIVNGQPGMGVVPLRNGDIIEVAGAKMRFTYAEASGLAVLDEQPTEKFALPGVALPDARPRAQARLTVLTGPETGRSWPVTTGIVSIGRGPQNLVILPHPSVSRHHAQIVVQAEGLFIQDVGSSNGASVNGEALTAPRPLRDGDHIQIGDILLVIAIDPLASAVAPENLPTQQLRATLSNIPPIADGPPAFHGALTHPRNRSLPDSPSLPPTPEAEPPPSQFRPPGPPQAPPSVTERPMPRFRPPVRPDDEGGMGS